MSNTCEGPSSRIKMSYLLLSTCTEELISTPKIITFLPNQPVGNEKNPVISNPISYLEYLYWSTSVFFTNLTAPDNEFPSK